MQLRRGLSLEEGKDSCTKTRVLQVKLLLILFMFLVLCVVFSLISLNTLKNFGVVNDPCVVEGEDYSMGGLNQWIKPPSNLIHTMTDDQLFWRATLVSSNSRKYPFNRIPKIAFMFLTKGPLPFAPLWERFFKGHHALYSIYIHTSPSYNLHFPSTSVFYRRLIPSNVTEWGKISICDAERRLLANALLDISNEWFVLLSESCIPLYNFSIIHSYITRSKHSFIRVKDDPGVYGRGRYNENMAPVVNITQWRKGYQWFEINRRLAIKVVEDTTFYPKFEAFCKPHCYVDEHYFPTMLTIQAPNLLANRSITWVDWSRFGYHPGSFGKGDITPEFFEKIRKSERCEYNGRSTTMCFLFARKFAPNALEPLLQAAPKVFGF